MKQQRKAQIMQEALSVLATFGKLRKLSLEGSPVDDATVSQLSSSKSLISLNLKKTQITGNGLRFSDTLEDVD